MTKGREVYVEGRLRLRSWTTAEGIDKPSLELSAWTCQLLGQIGRQAPRRRGPWQEPVPLGAGTAGRPRRDLGAALGLDDPEVP